MVQYHIVFSFLVQERALVEKDFLFCKLSSLGDIIQTLPAAFHLKRSRPGVFITYVVDEAYVELVSCFDEIDDVIGIPFARWKKGNASLFELTRSLRSLRKKQYDCSIDLQGNVKSGITHAFIRSKRKCGEKNPREWPSTWMTQKRFDVDTTSVYAKYLSLVCQVAGLDMPHALPIAPLLEREGNILVAPLSRWRSKMLPEDSWDALGDRFELLQDTSLSLSVWVGKTRRAAGIVCVDSAQLALATVCGVPTLSFFGPSKASFYAPPREGSVAIQGTCPLHVSFHDRCPHLRTCTNMGCMKRHDVTHALKAFEESIKVDMLVHK